MRLSLMYNLKAIGFLFFEINISCKIESKNLFIFIFSNNKQLSFLEFSIKPQLFIQDSWNYAKSHNFVPIFIIYIGFG